MQGLYLNSCTLIYGKGFKVDAHCGAPLVQIQFHVLWQIISILTIAQQCNWKEPTNNGSMILESFVIADSETHLIIDI